MEWLTARQSRPATDRIGIDEDERDIENWNPRRSHAWFAGWAPAQDPDLVIVVFVEHGGSGGRVAWPIARQILEAHYSKTGAKRTADPTDLREYEAIKRELLQSGKPAIKAIEAGQ